jgi:hypothetical protein
VTSREYVDSLEIEGPERRKRGCGSPQNRLARAFWVILTAAEMRQLLELKFPKEPKRAYSSYTSRSIRDHKIAKN